VSEAIKKEIREEILHKIKTTGLSVSKASEQYGVSTKAIYSWLSKDGAQVPNLELVRKLKKRNQELLTIIGILTYEIENIKKGRR
jgi:transposase-like protein